MGERYARRKRDGKTMAVVTSTVRVRTVHADGVEQERPHLRTRHTLTFQVGCKLQLGAAERAWHCAEVKSEDSGARKTVVFAPSMRKRDQLLRRSAGNFVPRQQRQKLVVLWVSVSDCSRHEYSGGRECRKQWNDGHG
jgi:hypothetical protein